MKGKKGWEKKEILSSRLIIFTIIFLLSITSISTINYSSQYLRIKVNEEKQTLHTRTQTYYSRKCTFVWERKRQFSGQEDNSSDD